MSSPRHFRRGKRNDSCDKQCVDHLKAMIALERLRGLNSRIFWPFFTWPDFKEKPDDKAKEVIELVLSALAQLWADWRVWNRLHSKKKA